MKTWRQALRDSLFSGAVASIVSTIAISVFGKREEGTPYGPNNAVSHWIWGDRAMHKDSPSLRYTLIGYAIHHASSTFWASLYERWFCERADRGEIAPALGGGLLVAALACFTDFNLTPPRLRPGFERRLSNTALATVYASFGLGLAAHALARARKRS